MSQNRGAGGDARVEGMRRREVISLGSVALVSVLMPDWLATPARAQGVAVAEAEANLPLSVGYLEGSDGLPRLDRFTWKEIVEAGLSRRVVPAADTILGDQTLAGQSVRVTVHGFYPALPLARRLERVALVVWFPALDPALPQPLPFFAWEYKSDPARNVGQRVSFVVPLEHDGGLELALHAVGQPRGLTGASLAGVERRAMRTRFTVDWQTGRPRLQRGVYFLGIDPGAWSAARTLKPPGARPDMAFFSLLVSVEPAPEKLELQ